MNLTVYIPALPHTESFPKQLLEEIEDYWHDNKLKSRNEAIRELVILGLKTVKPVD